MVVSMMITRTTVLVMFLIWEMMIVPPSVGPSAAVTIIKWPTHLTVLT